MKNIISLCFLFSIMSIYTLDNGLGLTPQMGWNTWNKFACGIDEELIKNSIDAIISSGLKDAGYNIYLLSNYPEEMGEVHWANCSFLPLVDGYIMSSKVKLCKPDPAIYKALRDKYDIRFSESIFVDDREDNCKASIKLGMDAICFKDYEELISSFKKRGVEFQ